MKLADFEFKDNYDVYDLLKITRLLRSENGCPWDKVQTHQTIRNNLIEEAYEAADAIDRNSAADMCEELGDLLLQVVFHSVIGEETNEFTLDKAADGVCKKLILRHPHVFGEVKADTPAQVLDNWDKIKMQEKHQQSYTDTLESVPQAFPALMRAQKLQKRAAKAGFDWDGVDGPLDKVEEELRELREAIKTGENVSEEFADLLFSCVNISRFIKADSEEALQSGCNKFIRRFSAVEKMCDKSMDEMSPDELNALWEKAKESE